MVIHDQVDWRTFSDAFMLDASLVESVFRRVAKKGLDNQGHDHTINWRDYNELKNHQFTKAEILHELETSGFYLQKRPFLRRLHTQLSCVFEEKELESVLSYVRHRVRIPKLSLSSTLAILKSLYASAEDLADFECQVQAAKKKAEAVSIWCVRDKRNICKSPAQLYGVHIIPHRENLQVEIKDEKEIVQKMAFTTVNSAVNVVIERLSVPYRRSSSKISIKAPHRNRIQSIKRQKTELALIKREQSRLEDKRKQLLISLFTPTATSTSCVVMKTDDMEMMNKKFTKEEIVIAQAEANGNLRMAKYLLENKDIRAGIRRTISHVKNLHGNSEDVSQLIIVWRQTYRSQIVRLIKEIKH